MNLSFFRGGLSLKTLVTTFVGTFIAVGSNISLVYLFRKFFNTQPGAVKPMAQDAYAVFIFHAPIIVALSYLLQGQALEILLRSLFWSIFSGPRSASSYAGSL